MRIRTVFTLSAVIGAGFGLRWVTAGSLASVSRDDLASLAVLAVAAVAWCAYAWLAVVTAATVLEQLPGALGHASGAIASGLTSAGSRALLRSTLGIAAVTPLTIGLAHATPTSPTSWTTASTPAGLPDHPLRQWPGQSLDRAPDHLIRQSPGLLAAQSMDQVVDRSGRGTAYGDRRVERVSTVDLGAGRPSAEATRTAYLGVERASTVGPGNGWSVEQPRTAGRDEPGKPRGRVVVPDRPTVGAATRYTPIRSPRRVVVRPGDTLWSIARAELGPNCSDRAIAARWPAWYATNAAVIGPDPDQLEPGQVLKQPSPSAEVLRLSSTSQEN